MKNVDWPVFGFVVTYQSIVLVTLPFYLFFTPPSIGMVLATILLIILTGVGITAGYHRLYAHKAYRANVAVEAVLLFFSSMASEGSVFEWASKHRLHHRFVDREGDPYNVKKGFFHAHMLWFFQKQPRIDMSVIPDLAGNKLLVFQHRNSLLCSIAANLSVCALVGFLLDDYAGALLLATGLRMLVVHHGTWFINSAAHYWGAKTYSKELSAVDNFFLALITFGEGYHNYHHVFASDYRNGIKWYHYDPTKWLIWSLNRLGLAQGLVRTDVYTTKKRLIGEDKKLLLETVKGKFESRKDVLERYIEELSAKVNTAIEELKASMEEYRSHKMEKAEKSVLRPLRAAIKERKKGFRKEWAQWCQFSKRMASANSINDKVFKEILVPSA